ncbi:hypothetical protein Mh1961_05510 [Mannheimia haemolytica]
MLKTVQIHSKMIIKVRAMLIVFELSNMIRYVVMISIIKGVSQNKKIASQKEMLFSLLIPIDSTNIGCNRQLIKDRHSINIPSIVKDKSFCLYHHHLK